MNVQTKEVVYIPKSKEQFEEIREKSRSIIMKTALKLFSANGYHATSISAIAKEAGIAAGLMYNYFKGKEDLLVKIIEERFLDLNRYISEQLPDEPIPDIGEIIDATLKGIDSMKDSWKLLISIMFQPDVSQIATEWIGKLSLHQQEIYEKYYVIKGIKNPKESAQALSAVMHGIFLSYAHSGDSAEVRLLRNTVIKTLIEKGI
ncbi:MAG: TetR/AcrR family transcriptional regulator [Bacillota bacterium]|nr:TetR/AcrR family transcriptional regulator [Bacillota bacterium]